MRFTRFIQISIRAIFAALASLSLSVGVGAATVFLNPASVFHPMDPFIGVYLGFCGVLGGFIGALSAVFATLTKLHGSRGGNVGFCIGAGLGLVLGVSFVVRLVGHWHIEWRLQELEFWLVVMMVIAGSLSGAVGGLLAGPQENKLVIVGLIVLAILGAVHTCLAMMLALR